MTHQDVNSEPITPLQQNLEVPETQTEDKEWWKQFGDCYDFWPSLLDSEFDYLYWGLVKKKQPVG